MKQYRYGVVGRFSIGKDTYGGQTIKTRNFTDELEKVAGQDQLLRVDTHGWKKHPIKLVLDIKHALSASDEIIMLPADGGVLVIPRLLMFLRGLRKTKIYYVVIGGWLPEFLQGRKGLARCLKKFDAIFVETKSMKTALEKQGFDNVVVLPNFKNINVLTEGELVYPNGEPYKLCTFSRVLKEKGIADAVNAVRAVNEKLGRTAYMLDIYGKIDAGYEEDFAALSKEFPDYIRYMGAVDGSKSTEIIKNYFALLFPTYFYGEGYPGTLLDAFSAGVPVIASDWRYNGEIVEADKGFLHEPKNVDALAKILHDLIKNPETLINKKMNCLAYARTMKPEEVIKVFCERTENLL